MIDKGMEHDNKMLHGLIALAEARIAQIKSGEKPALAPDANAKYAAEVVIDLDAIDEPMIADPDVNNEDVSKRYTHMIPSAQFHSIWLKRRWIWDLSAHVWFIRAM